MGCHGGQWRTLPPSHVCLPDRKADSAWLSPSTTVGDLRVQDRTISTRQRARIGRTGRPPGHRSSTSIQLLRLLLSLALGTVMACASPPVMGPPNAPPIDAYVVGAPDELQIVILPAPEINRTARVRPDGMITVDLVGDVQAAGRTPVEIAESIQKEISRYKRDAVVNVSLETSTSRFVTIYGEVGAPGIYALDTETRISEAIGRAGGARPFAKLGGVRIIRPTGSAAEVVEVHLDDIQEGDLSTNLVVRDGDLIVVPPTALARIGYAMQMLFFPFQPLLSGASTAGSIYGFSNN